MNIAVRHAELVSASILQHWKPALGAPWILKQVQDDGEVEVWHEYFG